MASSESKILETAIGKATETLREEGIENPRLDAELLMAFLLGTDRLHVLVDKDRALTENLAAEYGNLVTVRSRRVPLAYITGEREFYGLPFKIVPGVLVPRPETEGLVEHSAAALSARPGPVRILDIGSGSGCVAIALAKALPNSQITAIDSDKTAVTLTQENAKRLSVADRVEALSLDFRALSPQSSVLSPGFDAVASNPPYIPAGEIDSLQPEVSQFEPRAALDGGVDGLDLIRKIISIAPALLAPGGFVAIEIGLGESDAVVKLAKVAGFKRIRVFPDLAGIPRIVLMSAGTRVLSPDDPDALRQAADAIHRGEPVAFPTETIYGLGVLFSDEKGIERIYEAKGRDEVKPIALLVSDTKQIDSLARAIPEAARRLMEEYFPGPLTIILEAGERIPEAVSRGTGKVGIRMPDHGLALELIRAVGKPLAATSANSSGGPEPRSAIDVLDQIGGRIELVLDAGPTTGGVPSTVVDLTESPPKILREGAISRTDIMRCV